MQNQLSLRAELLKILSASVTVASTANFERQITQLPHEISCLCFIRGSPTRDFMCVREALLLASVQLVLEKKKEQGRMERTRGVRSVPLTFLACSSCVFQHQRFSLATICRNTASQGYYNHWNRTQNKVLFACFHSYCFVIILFKDLLFFQPKAKFLHLRNNEQQV